MAESGKKAIPAPLAPKPPLPAVVPAAGVPATPPTPSSIPPAAVTAATDINLIRNANPSAVDTGVGSMAAIHAVPTVGDHIGKYVVDRLIGSGGMGLVVAARHEALGELVAIKLLRPKAAGDKIHAERFAREARAIIKIKSEHVVRVLDAGTLEGGGVPYIVMEYLVGRDLAQILREEGPMPTARGSDLMLQVCEAVASAHAVGVVHRDLKPSNFFVTERADGTTLVKVLDFGISKAIGQDGVVDPNLTETQAVFGSPTYMSPEQIRSAKHVDHRGDIWSLGVGLYEILTGKLPFAADNVAGLLASIVADPPYFPKGFVADLPQELEELLLACLNKDPRQRVQTVGELAMRLAPFATQNVETHNLIERIQRLSKAPGAPAQPAAGQPPPGATTTTGPKLPSPAAPSASVSSPGIVMHAWQPHVPPEARLSGVTFGKTGMDLSAEAPPPSGRGFVAAVGIGITIAFVVIVGVVGAYWFGTRRAPVVTSPPEPPPVVSTVSTTPPPPSATPAESAAAGTPSARPTAPPTGKKPPPKHGPKGNTTAPSTPATATATRQPSDPTNDRF